MQWQCCRIRAPFKFRTHASVGKVMATAFCDAEGILMTGYMPQKTTVTGLYYAELLKK